MVENPPANAEGVRDPGLIPGSEDPLEEGMATHSSVRAWRTHGQRDGLWGRKESDTTSDLASTHGDKVVTASPRFTQIPEFPRHLASCSRTPEDTRHITDALPRLPVAGVML